MRILFILILLFSSCSASDQPQLTGNYEATSENLFTKAGWFLEGKRHIRSGTKLALQPDSTFVFETCGCKSSGNWKLTNDSVSLFTVKNKFTRQPEKGRSNCNTSNYKLNEGKLYRIQYEKSKWVECLAKVN